MIRPALLIATACCATALFGAAAPVAPPAPALSVIDRIAGPDGGWDYASFDPVTRRLFVARGAAVMAVDVDQRVVTPALATAQRAHAVLPVPGTGELVETDGTSGTARLIDKRTGAVRATIAVGQKPDAAIYDAVTRDVIVMNAKSGTLSIIDPAKAVVTATITLAPGLEFGAIDRRRRLFVNNEDAGVMHVVDLRTRQATGVVTLTGCESPTGLAYLAAADRLVAACANGKAAIVDPATRTLVGLVDIGRGPDAAIADEARRRVYIPCGQSATLEVIGFMGAGPSRVVAHVPTASGARTGALDPSTGRIYLPSARFAPAVGTARPAAIAGSFAVIVVGPVNPTPARHGG